MIFFNQFLFINFWFQLGHYLSFKLFLKIIKPINESNILNVASLEVYFPSENLQNMITCKEETS